MYQECALPNVILYQPNFITVLRRIQVGGEKEIPLFIRKIHLTKIKDDDIIIHMHPIRIHRSFLLAEHAPINLANTEELSS